jgi:hypothetical protein
MVVPWQQMERIGWIAPLGEHVGIGTILGNWHAGRKLLGSDASVYLNLGARDGVVAGDLLHVVEDRHVVHHPRTGEEMGRLVTVAGLVEVTEVRNASSTARVLRAFGPIEVGDAIVPRRNPAPVTSAWSGAPSRELRATVVASSDNRMSLAEQDIIFLDVGSRQEVKPGDHFLLRASDPLGASADHPRYTAEAVVVSAEEESCTAMITRSMVEAFVGDRAVYTNRPLPDIFHQ